MHFTALLPLVVLPLALAKDIPVKVGDQGNDFNPKTITGAKGDVVVFSFLGGDHSVAQSSFDKPCHPVDNAFYSGFIPGDKNSPKTFNITLVDDKPIWVYCSQGDHCYGDGMILSINAPTSGNTADAFAANAKKETEATNPPKVQNAISGGSASSSSASSSSASSSSASSSAASASSTGSSASAKATSSGTSTGTASKTSSSTTSTAKSGAVGNVNAGVGMGVMGLLGVLAGGMI